MSGGGSRKGTLNSKLLRVNSSNKSSGTNENFRVSLGSNLQLTEKLSILNVQFPNVFYNLYKTTEHASNYFGFWQYDGLVRDVFEAHFEPGYYSAEALLTAFQDWIEGIDIEWSINPITNKVTITNNSEVMSFGIFLETKFIDSAPITYDRNPFTMLGFDVPQVDLDTYDWNQLVWLPETSVTATHQPDLNPFTIAYLESSAISPSNSFDEEGKVSNILLAIPITSPWTDLVLFDCKQDVLCEIEYIKPRALNSLDIRLVDHEGYLLPLDNHDLNIEFRVWFNDY